MTPDPTAAIYAALKAEPHGLTATGLAKRLPYSRSVIQTVLQGWEGAGHVTATKEALRPTDNGHGCRYRLVTP